MPKSCQTANLFIGCDVSKAEISICILSQDQSQKPYLFTVPNTKTGMRRLIKEAQEMGSIALCVCEPTGGYEVLLLEALTACGWPLHRADTRKAAAFAKSLTMAKTDALDLSLIHI